MNLTPELLADLRKKAEAAIGPEIQTAAAWVAFHRSLTPAIVLALLDALHDARTAYLEVHGVQLQTACNERDALRERVKALETQDTSGGCLLAGSGRGDCEHYVGLPGHAIPGQHDGPDDTVDAYGKPNGWCWACWRGKRIEALEAEVEALKKPKPMFGGLVELTINGVPVPLEKP